MIINVLRRSILGARISAEVPSGRTLDILEQRYTIILAAVRAALLRAERGTDPRIAD